MTYTLGERNRVEGLICPTLSVYIRSMIQDLCLIFVVDGIKLDLKYRVNISRQNEDTFNLPQSCFLRNRRLLGTSSLLLLTRIVL